MLGMPGPAHLVHLTLRVRLTKALREIPSMLKLSGYVRLCLALATASILFLIMAVLAAGPLAVAQSATGACY